ncbi:hypothetical protein D3C87_1614480 [compost metagenome]
MTSNDSNTSSERWSVRSLRPMMSSPTARPAAPRLATRYAAQSVSSSAPRLNQATSSPAPIKRWRHCAASVLLPLPAGPRIKVNLRSRPASISSSRRSRGSDRGSIRGGDHLVRMSIVLEDFIRLTNQ